jgi:hypothetical protein
MATSTYGSEHPGIDRIAGHFLDGNAIRHVICSNKELLVCKQSGEVVHRVDKKLDANYVPKSIGCIRSAQNGRLVLVIGGFREGNSGQVTCTISTDYPIADPVVFQTKEA